MLTVYKPMTARYCTVYPKVATDLIAWNFTSMIPNILLLFCVTYDNEPIQSDVLSVSCLVFYWDSSDLIDLTVSKFLRNDDRNIQEYHFFYKDRKL
jgi:hypothetical protein